MKDVVIFSSNTCGYCHHAKAYFNEKGIKYTEKNVSTDPVARQELISNGFMGVPIIYIGDEVVQGFDKKRIEALLG